MKDKKGILFVSEKYGFYGGIENYAYALSLVLNDLDWNVFGIFENCEGTKNNEEYILPFKTIFIYKPSEENSYLKFCRENNIGTVIVHKTLNIDLLRFVHRNFNVISVVHDHDYYCLRKHKYFPFTRKNCKLKFNPVICSLCASLGGMLAKDGRGRLQFKPVNTSGVYNALKFLRKSAKTVVLSDFMKNQLILNGVETDKIVKIHPFICTGEKNPSIDAVSNVLLYVGQITRGKGVDLLLSSLKNVKSDFLLKIVGKGNDENYIKKYIAGNGMEKKVEFIGFTLDVEKFYSDCSLVIVPSRWQEPFGLIGIEAFSKGKPVIGFDVGGISEWLRDGYNGWLIPEGSISQMTKAIDSALSDRHELEIRGENAFLTAKQFSKADFIKSFEELLRSTGDKNV